MEFLFTQDPYIIIIFSQDNIIIYYNWLDDKQWVITGQCNQCGKCIEGAVNPDTRPYNERLDIPITADMPTEFEECSLRGFEINIGN